MSLLTNVRGLARARDAALRIRVLAPRKLRAYWFTGVSNFGDQLSAPAIEWAAGVPVIRVTSRYKGKTLGVGSILQRALAPGDRVWGSGLISEGIISPPPDVNFLAVRGPLTRRNIAADVPEVYGDPALLLPCFHDRHVEKQYSVGIVPHYVDHAVVASNDPAVNVVDVAEPWKEVVDAIRSCDLIVSSSLHGLIVAEAYGIPAAWIRISDQIKGGSFKFHDYLLSTGREAVPPLQWSRGLSYAVRFPLPAMTFQADPLISAAVGLHTSLSRLRRGEPGRGDP